MTRLSFLESKTTLGDRKNYLPTGQGLKNQVPNPGVSKVLEPSRCLLGGRTIRGSDHKM